MGLLIFVEGYKRIRLNPHADCYSVPTSRMWVLIFEKLIFLTVGNPGWFNKGRFFRYPTESAWIRGNKGSFFRYFMGIGFNSRFWRR
jgi:hypothetical protein